MVKLVYTYCDILFDFIERGGFFMANAIYPKFKENLMKGNIGDLTAATIKCSLLAGYTYSASHELYSSISSYIVSNGTVTVTGTPTVTNGILKVTSAAFTSVTGSQVTAYVLWIDGATDYLIYYCDTGQTGIPVTPNGGNITITFDTGAYGIFAI
jgi:hypothetical protein